MEHTSTFDVNNALRLWLDSLAESPQFRPTDLAELESHVRDSVIQLETKGLSSEESFLIATRRVGTAEKLEPEFARLNRSPKLIVTHLAILAFLSIGCWFLWAMLMFPWMTAGPSHIRPLPAFTTFVVGCKSLMVLPPLLALAYCVAVLARKPGPRNSWVGFFALSAGMLMLLTFPVVVAVVLPIIDGLHQLAGK